MNSSTILALILSAAVTYFLHSTFLVLFVWGIDQWGRIKSLTLQERLWKTALAVPLVTTVVQLSWTNAQPVWEWQLGAEESTARLHEPVGDDPFAVDRSAMPMAPVGSDAQVFESSTVHSPEVVHQIPITPSVYESDVSHQVNTNADPIAELEFSSTLRPYVDELLEPKVVAPEAARRNPPFPDSSFSTPVAESSFSAVRILQAGIPVLLMTVSVFGMLHFLLRIRQLRTQLYQAEALTDGEAFELLRSLCRQHQLQMKLRLLLSTSCAEPAAVGVFLPAIVLPPGLESRLKSVELRALLPHELAHLVRRDTTWMWIGQLIQSGFAWQPLNRLAVKRWRMIAEFQCDEWATGSDTTGRVILARVLTEIAEWKSEGRLAFGASVVGPPLSQRVARLLSTQRLTDRWQHGWRRQVSRLMVATAGAAMTLFAPRMVPIPSAFATTPPDIAAAVQPDSKVNRQHAPLRQPSETEMSLLREEFNALARDLTLALELVSKQEAAPDVKHQVTAVAQKLEQLRGKIGSLEED